MLSRWCPTRLPLHARRASSSVSHPRRGRNLTERYRTLEKSSKTDTKRPTLLHLNGSVRTDTDTIAGFVIPTEPRAPTDDECCMSGCAVCVYDLYEETLAAYKESVRTLRAALSARHIPETEWPAHIRTGNRESRDVVIDAFEAMERALRDRRGP